MGFPDGSAGKESACNTGDLIQSLGREDPAEKEMATTPVFFSGESHGQRSLEDYSPWGCKELDITERLTFLCVSVPVSVASPLRRAGNHEFAFYICGFASVL